MELLKKVNYLTLVCGIISLNFFTACKESPKSTSTPSLAPDKIKGEQIQSNGSKIAYVNLDTLEAKYEFWSKKKVDFEKRQKSMEAEIEKLGRNLQSEAESFQRKAQSGALTQSEGESAQMKLAQMQQNLETRHQTLTEQLLKEQQDFNTELQKRLDDFLETYNKEKGYAYILSYSKSGGIVLFADKSLDITDDIVNGLNEENKKAQEER